MQTIDEQYRQTREENRFLILTHRAHPGTKIPHSVKAAFMNGTEADRDLYLANVLPEHEA